MKYEFIFLLVVVVDLSPVFFFQNKLMVEDWNHKHQYAIKISLFQQVIKEEPL
jgi:hypothetical protein